jgi:TPR repeat protein
MRILPQYSQYLVSPLIRANSFQIKSFIAVTVLIASLSISGHVKAEGSPENSVANVQDIQKLITPQLEDAQAAFNSGNYDLAFSLWQTRATQGYADAQVFVGLSYANGWGVDKNIKLASHWYQKAAKKDNATAQFLLGLHFISGEDADLPMGVMWLNRAANNGDDSAKRFLKKAKKRGWFDNVPRIKEENNNKVETVAMAGNNL